jgi:hypothetical protein
MFDQESAVQARADGKCQGSVCYARPFRALIIIEAVATAAGVVLFLFQMRSRRAKAMGTEGGVEAHSKTVAGNKSEVIKSSAVDGEEMNAFLGGNANDV